MGVAIGDVLVVVIFTLCFGFDLGRIVSLVLFHEGFENILESVGSDGGVGIGRWLLRSRFGLDVGILVFVVGRVLLLVNGHVIHKLLEFLVDEVSYKGGLIGRVARSFACQLIFHSIVVFDSHEGFEGGIGFGCFRFGAPDFECVVKEASGVNVVVTETKKLRVGDIFFAVFGKDLSILKLFE